MILILGRFFKIQVIGRDQYVERSKCQTHKREIIPAKRGSILDRKGKLLAISVDDIAIDSEFLENKNNRKYVANVKRFYPLGEIGGKILGFVGKDGYGLSGVEFACDKYLHGEDGWIIMQRNGKNYSYRKIGLPEKAPREGFNVVLTIDSEIQKIAQLTLKEAVKALKAKGGMCIVMSPFDGAILAMADEPTFNPNLPKKISIGELRSKCIGETYEPGSTFKLITAAVALEEKLKKEHDLIYGDMGTFKIYNEVIRDHKPWGYLTFEKAFTYSSNICFAKVATEIGNERFYRHVIDFGFGSKTGIDLPGEEAGIVHSVNKWSGRTCVTMAMGQEISVT
ncbi:MAG: penicillin-binding transpeptidase domain-containing protein, partial [Chitinispirillaceae bacterium]|nr:penicillin-binding transpeptidase domain-containing protein [Chitinispirillaceae bacterium]